MKNQILHPKRLLFYLLCLAASPIIILFVLLLINVIEDKNPSFFRPVRVLIPTATHDFLKEIVSETKNIAHIFDKTKKSRYQLLRENYNVLSLPQTQFLYLELKKVHFRNPEIYSGYIASFNGKIIFISRQGKTFYFDPRLTMVNEKLELIEIEHNLANSFSSDPSRTGYVHESLYQSVYDSLVHSGNIYISIKRERTPNCFNSVILRAPINFANLVFEEFFSYDECVASSNHIGGRMAMRPNNKSLLFTISDFNIGDDHADNQSLLRLLQDDRSMFGKIVSINLDDGGYQIISKGHRNPQGLIAIGDTILSTEHGPFGGDEINSIKLGENYGWPIASYGGPTYSNFFEGRPLVYKKRHEKFGFAEPLFAFVPAIGISQISLIPNEFSDKWQDSYFISSLNGRKLYRFIFDDDLTRVISFESIFIGQRIRDLLYDKKTSSFFLVLEAPGALGILSVQGES